jgi:ribonuclease HII
MARPRIDPSLIPAFPNLEFEEAVWACRGKLVAGLDEAGRGAVAGPIFAAAVILPPNEPAALRELLGFVRDSKQMSMIHREEAALMVKSIALAWAVFTISAAEVDKNGMAKAGRDVLLGAAKALKPMPHHLLLDYFRLPDCAWPQECLVKGDQRSLSIAAASVLAKTARDAHMRHLDLRYPGYGFSAHKGYATAQHYQAISELGLCPEHRRSFLDVFLQPGLFS